MTTCYLVRHGTTAWLDGNILHGITDIPLNEEGLKQANKAAKALTGIKADLLFASPLSRTFQTAEIIGNELGLQPVPIEEVQELNFGWLEGTKFNENDFIQDSSFRFWFNQFRENIIRTISGESRKKFNNRVINGWQKILAQSTGRDFFLVAHSGVFNAILHYYFNNKFANNGDFYDIHPCAITELKIRENGKAELVRLDDHAHLKDWFGKK